MINTTAYHNEYQFIVNYYGDRKAGRSGVPYINHINEGLVVLDEIGASSDAKAAYCLHGAFQDSLGLSINYKLGSYKSLNKTALLLVMEYRNIANSYLSTRQISHWELITLSPLPEVNQMLIADKVQNYKDFMENHSDSHTRSYELNEYFNNWFKRLGVSETWYTYLCSKIDEYKATV